MLGGSFPTVAKIQWLGKLSPWIPNTVDQFLSGSQSRRQLNLSELPDKSDLYQQTPYLLSTITSHISPNASNSWDVSSRSSSKVSLPSLVTQSPHLTLLSPIPCRLSETAAVRLLCSMCSSLQRALRQNLCYSTVQS